MKTANLIALLVFTLSVACRPPSPEAIEYGADSCHHCKMTLTDPRFGGEAVTAKGKVYKYDSLDCLEHDRVRHLGDRDVEYFAVDAAHPGRFVPVAKASYWIDPSLRSPMGEAVFAFGSREELEAWRAQGAAGGAKGFQVDWAGVRQRMGQAKPEASEFEPARVDALRDRVEVCPSCEVKSIRRALALTKAGGEIGVRAGVYAEGELAIQSSVRLLGSEGAVLDGGGTAQILAIRGAEGVEIRGFVIRNTGVSYVAELAGIRAIQAKGCVIAGNRFANTTYGVYLEKSTGCRVEDNVFEGQAKDESSSGNAIHVWSGGGHAIDRNRIQGHRDGIYLEFAKDCSIRGNVSDRNIRYGLHFMSSDNTAYENNSFSENGSGVAIMYSRRIRMTGNRFVHNTGTAAYGLLLKEIHDSVARGNELRGNTVALFMEGSNRSELVGNRFVDNGWGVKIFSDCENNRFEGNSFEGNSFEVSTNADHSWNTFRGNYWSHYEGYDLDHDGVGDVPHRPVSLSSTILERVDSSYILLHSFLFNLLDSVENALPVLIPEPLKDEAPRMSPA